MARNMNYKTYNQVRAQAEDLFNRAIASGNTNRAQYIERVANNYARNMSNYLSRRNARKRLLANDRTPIYYNGSQKMNIPITQKARMRLSSMGRVSH